MINKIIRLLWLLGSIAILLYSLTLGVISNDRPTLNAVFCIPLAIAAAYMILGWAKSIFHHTLKLGFWLYIVSYILSFEFLFFYAGRYDFNNIFVIPVGQGLCLLIPLLLSLLRKKDFFPQGVFPKSKGSKWLLSFGIFIILALPISLSSAYLLYSEPSNFKKLSTKTNTEPNKNIVDLQNIAANALQKIDKNQEVSLWFDKKDDFFDFSYKVHPIEVQKILKISKIFKDDIKELKDLILDKTFNLEDPKFYNNHSNLITHPNFLEICFKLLFLNLNKQIYLDTSAFETYKAIIILADAVTLSPFILKNNPQWSTNVLELVNQSHYLTYILYKADRLTSIDPSLPINKISRSQIRELYKSYLTSSLVSAIGNKKIFKKLDATLFEQLLQKTAPNVLMGAHFKLLADGTSLRFRYRQATINNIIDNISNDKIVAPHNLTKFNARYRHLENSHKPLGLNRLDMDFTPPLAEIDKNWGKYDFYFELHAILIGLMRYQQNSIQEFNKISDKMLSEFPDLLSGSQSFKVDDLKKQNKDLKKKISEFKKSIRNQKLKYVSLGFNYPESLNSIKDQFADSDKLVNWDKWEKLYSPKPKKGISGLISLVLKNMGINFIEHFTLANKSLPGQNYKNILKSELWYNDIWDKCDIDQKILEQLDQQELDWDVSVYDRLQQLSLNDLKFIIRDHDKKLFHQISDHQNCGLKINFELKKFLPNIVENRRDDYFILGLVKQKIDNNSFRLRRQIKNVTDFINFIQGISSKRYTHILVLKIPRRKEKPSLYLFKLANSATEDLDSKKISHLSDI